MAMSPKLSLAYKVHALKREGERGIHTPDVRFVLRNGFVLIDAVPATRVNYYKYEIEGRTPNSEGRFVRLVVIPDFKNCTIKLVTIMWVDEEATRAGTLLEATE